MHSFSNLFWLWKNTYGHTSLLPKTKCTLLVLICPLIGLAWWNSFLVFLQPFLCWVYILVTSISWLILRKREWCLTWEMHVLFMWKNVQRADLLKSICSFRCQEELWLIWEEMFGWGMAHMPNITWAGDPEEWRAPTLKVSHYFLHSARVSQCPENRVACLLPMTCCQ